MAIEIGNLVVEMSANIARLQTDMNKATGIVGGSMKAMSESMNSISKRMNLIVGSQVFQSLDLLARRGMEAFSAIKHSAIDAADELNKLSQKTGFSTESLSGLKYAAELSDLSLEGLTKGLKSLSVNLVEAKGGSKEMAETFRRLGISMDDPEVALMQLADRFQKMPDGAQKARDAVKLFGKEGLSMIPFLNQGRDGIAELTAEAKRFGLVIDGETARQAEAFNDNLTRLKANIGGLVQQMGTSMMPTLLTLSEKLIDAKTEVGGFDDSMRGMVGNRSAVEGFLESMAVGLAHVLQQLVALKRVAAAPLDIAEAVGVDVQTFLKKEGLKGAKSFGVDPKLIDAAIEDVEHARRHYRQSLNLGGTFDNPGYVADVKRFFEETRRTVRMEGQKYLMDSEQDAKLLQDAINKNYKSPAKPIKDLDYRGPARKAVSDAALRLASIKNADLDLDFAKVAAETEAIYARSQVLVKLQQNAVDAYADSLNDAAFAAADLQIKFNAMVDANAQAMTETAKSTVASLAEEIEGLRLRNEEIGLTAEQLALLTQTRLDVAIASKEQLYADTALTAENADYLAALAEQIKLLKEKKGLLGQGAARQLIAEEARTAQEEWKRASEDIERSLTDALMRGFEGGKDIGRNFVDTIKNYLKSQFLKPVAVKISASVMGAIGLGSSSTALASGGPSSSILSMGSAIANGLAPGAMSFAIGEGVAAGLSAVGASTGVATGIGSFVSSAIPVIGWIAAIAGLVKAFSTGGTPHLGTTREFGLSGGNSIVSIDDWRAAGGDATGLPGWLYGEGEASPYNDAVSAFGAQMVATINNDLKLLGGTLGKEFALQFGFAAENEAETASGGFARVMLGGENVLDIYKRYAKDGKTGIEQYMKEVAPKVELVAIQLADGLSPALSDMADTLDASTASVGSITELLADLNAAAGALNLQSVFADLNLTLGQTDTQIIATGLALRDLAGGFDALNAGATAYYQSFFSEAEQIANLSESLSSEFGKLNMSLPSSKAAFRALVESLDMTTSAGQSAFVTLMGLAPSFATLADYAETSAQAVAEVTLSLDAAFDALTRAVNAERGRINSVFDGLAQSLSAAVDELEDRISRKTGLSDALQTALDGLLQTAGLSMSRAVADAQVQAALLIAKTGGVLPDVATLQPALDALGQDNRSQYATRTDYLRDQMRSAAALDNLKKITDTQLSTDELALVALNTQIDENLRWKNDELAKLDSLIDQAQMQVDAANGINTAVLSLADAIAALNALTGKTTTTATKPATGNVVVGGGASAIAASAGYAYGIGTSLIMPAAPSQMAKLDSINQFLTSTYDGGTAAWFEDVYAYAQANGVRQSDIAAALNLPLSDVEQAAAAMGYPKFAAGGRYAGGMALVGEYGPELINFDGGGYIHTAPKTAAMIGNGNAALIDEIIALREEVSMLRAETRATAQHTGKTARLLERAMPDGDALSTREAT